MTKTTMLATLAFPLTLALATGCGSACPEGTYPVGDGACAPLDGEAPGPAGDDGDDSTNPDPVDPGPTDPGPTGGAVGDPCQEDADCGGSLFCVFEDYYDANGICTEGCSSWADCSEAFWECCDVGNGGSACIPDDWVDRNPYAVCD